MRQKLVKKIAGRGIAVKGLAGTAGYLYLQSIDISTKKPPEARVILRAWCRELPAASPVVSGSFGVATAAHRSSLQARLSLSHRTVPEAEAFADALETQLRTLAPGDTQ